MIFDGLPHRRKALAGIGSRCANILHCEHRLTGDTRKVANGTAVSDYPELGAAIVEFNFKSKRHYHHFPLRFPRRTCLMKCAE